MNIVQSAMIGQDFNGLTQFFRRNEHHLSIFIYGFLVLEVLFNQLLESTKYFVLTRVIANMKIAMGQFSLTLIL